MLGRLEKAWLALFPERARRYALPDFLGIGAQKAGTTWLYENLRRHPEVFVPPTKELHYFDLHYDRPLRDYAAHFEPGRDRVAGEVTPAYSILPRSRIRFIRTVMPDVRLVLLLRDPVDRAWSQVVMELGHRRGRKASDIPEAEAIEFAESEPCRRRGAYPDIVGSWLASFPREQLFIGFFEDIVERPRMLLTEVFRHVGVSTRVDWAQFAYAERVLPNVERVVPPGEWARFFRLDDPEAAPPPCPPAVRRRLIHIHEPEVEALARTLGEPVQRWLRGRG